MIQSLSSKLCNDAVGDRPQLERISATCVASSCLRVLHNTTLMGCDGAGDGWWLAGDGAVGDGCGEDGDRDSW